MDSVGDVGHNGLLGFDNSYGYKYSLSDFLLYGWNSRWNVLC